MILQDKVSFINHFTVTHTMSMNDKWSTVNSPSSLAIFALTDIMVSKGDTLNSKAVPVRVSIYNSIIYYP